MSYELVSWERGAGSGLLVEVSEGDGAANSG
jgi:hypothetical protein